MIGIPLMLFITKNSSQMKNLVKIFAFLLISYTAQSQAVVEITNNTNCFLVVQMYSVATGTCQYGTYQNYYMAPGSGVAAVAPTGQEWIYSEITSWPYCSGEGACRRPCAEVLLFKSQRS